MHCIANENLWIIWRHPLSELKVQFLPTLRVLNPIFKFQIIFGFTFPVVLPRFKVNKHTYFLRLYNSIRYRISNAKRFKVLDKKKKHPPLLLYRFEGRFVILAGHWEQICRTPGISFQTIILQRVISFSEAKTFG